MAPPARRGGWLSAWKRKQAMTMPSPIGTQHPDDSYTDYANVAPPHSSMKLYVGSKPPFDRDLRFDVLVLCAAELQPQRLSFSGNVLRCPIIDDALDSEQIKLVLETSARVAMAVATKKRVLVTCQAGINRSALVASMTLGRMTKMTASEIVLHMRSRRDPNALWNPHFRNYLERFIKGIRGGVPSSG